MTPQFCVVASKIWTSSLREPARSRCGKTLRAPAPALRERARAQQRGGGARVGRRPSGPGRAVGLSPLPRPRTPVRLRAARRPHNTPLLLLFVL